ncbi:O-antigen ligase family protein [Trinickia caryophylli]|uniref:O-antigen ligase n=1 Tax=Trinickia caryophylli TaxID=28094 RepID=A0A1X7GU36_TRICW|nr:O-antigen ligase family protein [Trinickia caryophylli]PMS08924.1 hypothetical protein C0Z17_27545 [Trinickia caryophylli]TRX18132.1 O-antigen ligase family protein [Trinickia caryophylli]WQE11084.1 O-antigen ligase family protein [Trinickia caryophylli]SMF74481.1 O-antigen ligase [Trinickia caryophylli]GLU35239.1 hypothetical protein Busp01_50810 [Trinickia caryophylli]
MTSGAWSPVRLLWLSCPLIAFAAMLAHMAAPNNMGIALTFVAVFWSGLSQPRAAGRWPLVVPIALWAAWSLAAVAWSAYPAVSFHAWLDEVLYPLLVFWGFWLFASQVGRADCPAYACLAACVALALISLFCWGRLQPPTPETFPLHFYPRVGHSSTLALFAIPVFTGLLMRGRKRWLGVVGVLLGVFIGFASLNRFFWPAVAVTLFVALFPLYRRNRKLAVVILAVVSAAGAAAVIYGAMQRFGGLGTAPAAGPQIEHRVQTQPPMAAFDDALAADTRPMLWAFYAREAVRHAWLGVGFGKPLPGMALRPEMPSSLLAHEPLAPTHAHNLLLNTWLQTGLPGLLLQVLLFASLAARFWALRRVDEWVAAAGIALVLGMMAKNFTDDFMWKTTMLAFWAFAGLLLGAGTRSARQAALRSAPAGMGRAV